MWSGGRQRYDRAVRLVYDLMLITFKSHLDGRQEDGDVAILKIQARKLNFTPTGAMNSKKSTAALAK